MSEYTAVINETMKHAADARAARQRLTEAKKAERLAEYVERQAFTRAVLTRWLADPTSYVTPAMYEEALNIHQTWRQAEELPE